MVCSDGGAWGGWRALRHLSHLVEELWGGCSLFFKREAVFPKWTVSEFITGWMLFSYVVTKTNTGAQLLSF